MTKRPPARDQAPLSPNGVFSVDAKGEEYVREEKFSVSWGGGLEVGEPSLVVTLSPLVGYQLGLDERKQQGSAATWVRNNLLAITHEWKKVLDMLDEQTTLPVC